MRRTDARYDAQVKNERSVGGCDGHIGAVDGDGVALGFVALPHFIPCDVVATPGLLSRFIEEVDAPVPLEVDEGVRAVVSNEKRFPRLGTGCVLDSHRPASYLL